VRNSIWKMAGLLLFVASFSLKSSASIELDEGSAVRAAPSPALQSASFSGRSIVLPIMADSLTKSLYPNLVSGLLIERRPFFVNTTSSEVKAFFDNPQNMNTEVCVLGSETESGYILATSVSAGACAK
jgi:hypothetical protein